MIEETLSVISPDSLLPLFGARDQHVRQIRDSLGVNVTARDGKIHVAGDKKAVRQATAVIEQLQRQLKRGGAILPDDVNHALQRVTGNSQNSGQEPAIEVMQACRQIRPKTIGQSEYLRGIERHDLVFATGPAGTGKTFLAVAMAVSALRRQEIRKIVLVRPAVEAGESLGYLPGDIQAKINPYLRPLLDALREMIDFDHFNRYTQEGVVEVIPLAYMRGRTLNDAFIILDEAQNTTVSQMKMFLTRMGTGSKIVVAGDDTQVDLPQNQKSGLVDAISRLRHIKGFCRIELTEADIVRHRLVQDIVRAYEDKPGARRGKGKQA
ncbi:MAG: PhoH family protein [Pirellulales bacterium]